MNRHIKRTGQLHRRRAVIAVQVAVLMVVMLGFAALTVDLGLMYNTRADLQRTADAAALAAADGLSQYELVDPNAAARAAALEFTQLNDVMNRGMTIDMNEDVVLGRAVYNDSSGQYDFTPTDFLPDAVRMRVRHTADSANGAVPLYFARIFGIHQTEMAADAVAIMVPRDIAIVVDLSSSHNDDSELKNWDNPDVNLMDVWDGLPVVRGVNGVGNGVDPVPPGDPTNPAPAPAFGPGGPGNGGLDPGTAPGGGQNGPTFGRMYWWGDDLGPDYDANADPGLMHLPRYQDWNDADLVDMYEAIGYSNDEINALLSDDFDGSRDSDGEYAWTNRVAVALGLARWNSGMPGGLWEMVPDGNPGNSNAWVGTSELTWLVDYPWPGGSWSDYIYNYTRKSNTEMANANGDFQYKFGLKTLSNYLLEHEYQKSNTPDLAETPSQPMKAVKDATSYMVDVLTNLNTNDQLSLEGYGTQGRHEVDLTVNYDEVSARLAELQAGHYDPWTNMGAGIQRAIEELSSPRARSRSIKMIILLTDGNANVSATGQPGDYSGGTDFALAQANAAAAEGMRIFAVSVGFNANQALMQQIADIAGGEHFHAEGSIEEYSQQLMDIFRRLGGTRPVELVQ